MKTGHERNQESLNQIFNTRENVKSGYAPYYNNSTISEKGKKAYEWLCDFVGQDLELGNHPWYGPTVYLDVNKMNITPEMLEEINNKMWEMDGHNSIAAQSGEWGYGNVYEVTFDQNHNVQSSRRPIKSSNETDYSFFQDIKHFLAKQKDKVSEMKSFDTVRLSIEFVIYNKFVSIVNIKNGSYRFNTYINLSSHEIPTYKGSDLQSFEHDFNEVCNLIGE